MSLASLRLARTCVLATAFTLTACPPDQATTEATATTPEETTIGTSTGSPTSGTPTDAIVASTPTIR